MDWGSLISSSSGTHKVWAHLHRRSHNNGRREKRATCYYQLSNRDCCSPHPHLLSSSASWWFHRDSNISQQHFHFVKTPFFLVIYRIFCYKTSTGCLEQQQKYNIQFICNFFSLIIVKFIGWILLEFVFLLIVPSPLSQMASSPSGCWWGGRVQINI